MEGAGGPTTRIADWAALSADGWLLFATCGIRNFAYGFLAVILGLYLAALGLGPSAIGDVFAAALAGGALMTVAVITLADRVGRRHVLVLGAALMALAGAVFAVTDNLALLILAAIFGTISPSGKEVGPFLSLEQAILPQTTSQERRTAAFTVYNLVGSLAGALGALTAGLPPVLGLAPLSGFRLLVAAYALIGLALLLLFLRLSPAVEATHREPDEPRVTGARRLGLGIHRLPRMVAALAVLFALDAFAGGFVVQGLMAYWFSLRFGADLASLGAIFSAANLLSALSLLAAPPLARRFGLLNTMVFTHLPSNVLLLLVPLMPSFELAVGMLLARQLLSQLDVPARQSYTMAVVAPAERTAAAGLTSVARNAATALAPPLAFPSLANPQLGLPFLIAGSLKIVYDLTILATFRSVRPPEERSRG